MWKSELSQIMKTELSRLVLRKLAENLKLSIEVER